MLHKKQCILPQNEPFVQGHPEISLVMGEPKAMLRELEI